MLTNQIYPKNKDFFLKLVEFGKGCQAISTANGFEPVIYGSVAYLFYAKDDSIEVNDIDFLVPETALDVLAAEFARQGLKYEITTYHSLKVFKDEIKISFDSVEHYLQGISELAYTVKIEGENFKVLNPESLKKVYKQGAENIPFKKDAYSYKLKHLSELP